MKLYLEIKVWTTVAPLSIGWEKVRGQHRDGWALESSCHHNTIGTPSALKQTRVTKLDAHIGCFNRFGSLISGLAASLAFGELDALRGDLERVPTFVGHEALPDVDRKSVV